MHSAIAIDDASCCVSKNKIDWLLADLKCHIDVIELASHISLYEYIDSVLWHDVLLACDGFRPAGST